MTRDVRLIPRALMASVLCFAFVTSPGSRVSASLKTSAIDDIKTESQFRGEARSYDDMLRAISQISSSKLDTPEALQEAIDRFQREHTKIGFHRSKLVLKALADPTFVNAIKRTANSEAAAERLLRTINADINNVLKIDGAKLLASKLESSLRADAEVLRKAGEQLKLAGERFKERAALDPAGNKFRMVPAMFVDQPSVELNDALFASGAFIAGFGIILAIAITVALVVVASYVTQTIVNLVKSLFPEEQRDEVVDCQKQANDRWVVCIRAARGLGFFEKMAAETLCNATFLADQSACLLKGVRL